VDVEIHVIRSPVGEPMNEVGVAVIGEDHRPVLGEERVELVIGETVRVGRVRLHARKAALAL
jgi:hypothetical protein